MPPRESPPVSDTQCIELYLLCRDERAATHLVRRHETFVRKMVANYLEGFGGWADMAVEVADCTQRVWDLVFRNLARYDANRGTFEAWLAIISRNVAFNARRDARRKKRVTGWWPSIHLDRKGIIDVDMADDSAWNAPTTEVELLECVEALERALATLTEGERRILLLSMETIEPRNLHARLSAALSIVPGTAKSRLSRARAKLRQAYRAITREDRDRRGARVG